MSHDKSSPDHLYHHFYDVDQQYETSKLGMWAFILTEVLTFGGLFVAYTIYRAWHPDMFFNANLLLDVNKGLINTIVLIASSLTMALAIWAIQLNKRKLSLLMFLDNFLENTILIWAQKLFNKFMIRKKLTLILHPIIYFLIKKLIVYIQ